jgi:hypothetical protein
VRYGSNYAPTLDDMPSDLELIEQQLPDVKDWETAVQRVSAVFGLAISQLLNASNLTMLASKVKESVGGLKADCDLLPDRLQLVLKNLGVPEGNIGKADRVCTAKAVRKLLADCEGKEATALVRAIAEATIETSGTAMGRSFKSAAAILECLRNTKWDLFQAVSHLGDERMTQADMLLEDVRSALCTDELALSGGLASKLSDAESRAIKLLTPPKPPPPSPPPLPPPPPPTKGWKEIDAGSHTWQDHDQAREEAENIVRKLGKGNNLRLTIHWALEEKSE